MKRVLRPLTPGAGGATSSASGPGRLPAGSGLVHAAAGGLVAVLSFLVIFLLGPFEGAMKAVMSAVLAALAGGLVLFLPQLQEGRRGDRIDEALPFFITHFGVLATTDMPREEMLRILSHDEEHKDVAREVGRIHRLTTEWGLGMVDAVRAVAQTTPSEVFGQFLLRLAHAVESGQSLEAFLRSEQGVVMQEYASLYEAQLLKVENWKELYTSTVMTIGFLAVFAAIMPVLAGGDVFLLMAGVALLAAFLEVMMGILLRERIPSDRLLPLRPIETLEERWVLLSVAASVAAAVTLGALAWRFDSLPLGLLVGAVPLLVPGFLAGRSEKRIRQREEDFPAFVRSLGAAAAARGGGVREVLGHVQANDLGALTEPVRALHRRLSWRIDDQRSWSRFGAQTGSRLVDRFTDMFVHGVRSGGKPGAISQIISDNMVRILGLRTNRRATAGAFRGLLLGLAAGLAMVLFVGAGVFETMMGLFGDSAELLASQGILEIDPDQSTGRINDLLFGVVGVHAVASAFFLKMLEGGRMGAGLGWVTLHMVLGVGAGLFVVRSLPRLLG